MAGGLRGGSVNACRGDRGYLSTVALAMIFVTCVAISLTIGMAAFL